MSMPGMDMGGSSGSSSSSSGGGMANMPGMNMGGGGTMADMPGMNMGGMDMGGMNMGGGGSMMMMSVFSTAMNTPLYSMKWTPDSVSTYAATCVFLVALGALFRFLLAFKGWQENRWLDAELRRRYVVVPGRGTLADRLSHDSMSKEAVLSENGVEERVVVVQRRTVHARPWRLSVEPVRAVIDTIIAGVGYLLMLAVMTMNVGYFLAVLGGTFLGSLLIGRFVGGTEH